VGVVADICNPSTQDVETGGLRVQGYPVLHSEFETRLGYIVRPYLKRGKINHHQQKNFCKTGRRKSSGPKAKNSLLLRPASKA
jgi:hypothetical protein